MIYIKYDGNNPPKIKGLVFGWARESQYPTDHPEYFGMAPDGTDPKTPGIISVWSEADYEHMRQDELSARKEPLRKYLSDTDWVVSKISERKLVGDDVTELLKKYRDVIDEREKAREELERV